jgi:hypothetical protein
VYNMIIASNFFTTEESVSKYANSLIEAARSLRRGGALLFVGARPQSKKYEHVYDQLSDLITSTQLGTYAYHAGCSRQEGASGDIEFEDFGRFGDRIFRSRRLAVTRILELGGGASIPPELQKRIMMPPCSTGKTGWRMLVLKKWTAPARKPRGKRHSAPKIEKPL